MLVSEYDYELPDELIAQMPADKRENSRMMVLDKWRHTISHKHFYDIVDLIEPNSLLVLNDTKVLPARLFGVKEETGAKIEIFLLKKCPQSSDTKRFENTWQVLIKPSKRVKPQTKVRISEELLATVVEKLEDDGEWIVEFDCAGDFMEVLHKCGNLPLPPYIERKLQTEEIKNLDFERYQTVYARDEGSVAAPTAGLHFTKEILSRLQKEKGIDIAYVTLNVGMGTFRPVKTERIEDHKMHSETFEISEVTAKKINEAKKVGKKIIAVGTTSVRTLETAYKKYGRIQACHDSSELFIYPPYEFKVIDSLITNFHLPKSTLLMLVSALAGKDFIFDAYAEAVEEKYRFFSYGDCMYIK